MFWACKFLISPYVGPDLGLDAQFVTFDRCHVSVEKVIAPKREAGIICCEYG